MLLPRYRAKLENYPVYTVRSSLSSPPLSFLSLPTISHPLLSFPQCCLSLLSSFVSNFPSFPPQSFFPLHIPIFLPFFAFFSFFPLLRPFPSSSSSSSFPLSLSQNIPSSTPLSPYIFLFPFPPSPLPVFSQIHSVTFHNSLSPSDLTRELTCLMSPCCVVPRLGTQRTKVVVSLGVLSFFLSLSHPPSLPLSLSHFYSHTQA